ncbi:MAG: Rpn family recombination-promoting nuclease/putative transposase, partial [Phocaeicola sp.]|nr:Rpn family recombination-promoting nuclease/putative transposase [Phocaeicola sp.]
MAELRDRCICFDWAIKMLLRQNNFGVLEGFLTVFLDQKVTIVEILESEGGQEREDDKFNRVDIKAKNSKGEIIIVEIQNMRILHYFEHIQRDVCKAVTEHIKPGDTYKVYSINILYFDLGIGSDYLYVGQSNFVGVHTNDQLIVNAKEKDVIVHKRPSDIFPTYYLVRVNNFNQHAVTPLEEWVDYLKNGVIREDTSAPGLQEAREKLRYYSMSDVERHAYDEHINAVMIQNDVLGTAKLEGLMEGRAEGRAEGIAQGRAEGRAEGITNEKYDTARKMLSLNIPIETIMEVTGLSEDEIRE